MKKEIACQQCGGKMNQAKRAEKNMAMQLLGVVVFLIGLPLLLVVPIGTVFGIILMLVGMNLGYRQKKIWLCPDCGHSFEITK